MTLLTKQYSNYILYAFVLENSEFVYMISQISGHTQEVLTYLDRMAAPCPSTMVIEMQARPLRPPPALHLLSG